MVFPAVLCISLVCLYPDMANERRTRISKTTILEEANEKYGKAIEQMRSAG